MKIRHPFLTFLVASQLANAQTNPPASPALVHTNAPASPAVVNTNLTNGVQREMIQKELQRMRSQGGRAAFPTLTPRGTNTLATPRAGTSSVTNPPAATLNTGPTTLTTLSTNAAGVPGTVPNAFGAAGRALGAGGGEGVEEEPIIPVTIFNEMPLVQFLDYYSALVGRTILRAAGGAATLPTVNISLKTQTPLTRSEMITACNAVMAMNGVTVVPIGDKFVKIVPEGTAHSMGAPFSEIESDKLPLAGAYVTQIVQIKYVPLQEVQTAIQPFAKAQFSIIPIASSQTLVLRDYSENVKRMMEIIEKIDIITPLEVKPEVIPIKYASASDIQSVLGSLSSSGPGVSVGRSATGGAGGGAGGRMGGGFNNPSSGLGGQNLNQPNTGFGNPGLGGAAGGARSTFQNRLSSIVNRAAQGAGDFQILGQAKIIADERTNSLLIFANEQDMVMIKDIVARLDVVLAQVLIESIIMEVSLDDSRDLGFDYRQNPTGSFRGAGAVNNVGYLNAVTNIASIANTAPGGFSYFGQLGNSFDFAVKAIATDSRINVLSRPSVQTSHAVPATLFVGNSIPVVTGTINDINGGARSQYTSQQIGIHLDVTPLINPDGLVVMDIQQQIQQLGTPATIDGNQVPTTTDRNAQAKVAVRDRDTVILGGFISSTKSDSNSGVPFLKDIPVLGGLFRSTNKSSRRVELLVLIRPTVLPTPESAAIAANGQREELPGIRKAEMENREEERRRQEQTDNEIRKKLGLKKK